MRGKNLGSGAYKLTKKFKEYQKDVKFKQGKDLDVVKVKSKKKYPCKRLKGDHNFIFVRAEKLVGTWCKGLGKWILEWKCSACGKKEIDISEEYREDFKKKL